MLEAASHQSPFSSDTSGPGGTVKKMLKDTKGSLHSAAEIYKQQRLADRPELQKNQADMANLRDLEPPKTTSLDSALH